MLTNFQNTSQYIFDKYNFSGNRFIRNRSYYIAFDRELENHLILIIDNNYKFQNMMIADNVNV